MDKREPDMVMVPREPTEAMIAAAERLYDFPLGSSTAINSPAPDAIWSAMLSAAPSEGGDEPVAREGDMVLAPRWAFQDFLDNAPGWPDTARRYLNAPSAPPPQLEGECGRRWRGPYTGQSGRLGSAVTKPRSPPTPFSPPSAPKEKSMTADSRDMVLPCPFCGWSLIENATPEGHAEHPSHDWCPAGDFLVQPAEWNRRSSPAQGQIVGTRGEGVMEPYSVGARVVALLKQHGFHGLAGYDGCLCGGCALWNVEIEVSCRKASGGLDFRGTLIRVQRASLDAQKKDLLAVANEVYTQMAERETHTPIMVRFCSYEDDSKQRCIYCREPRPEPLGYLCDRCLTKTDSLGRSIAEQYDYSGLFVPPSPAPDKEG